MPKPEVLSRDLLGRKHQVGTIEIAESGRWKERVSCSYKTHVIHHDHDARLVAKRKTFIPVVKTRMILLCQHHTIVFIEDIGAPIRTL